MKKCYGHKNSRAVTRIKKHQRAFFRDFPFSYTSFVPEVVPAIQIRMAFLSEKNVL